MSPHGTISRYTNDKCRCPDCRLAKLVYEGKRMMGRRTRVLIPAYQARRHARFLLMNGWGSKSLGDKVGASRHAILNLASGKTKYIRQDLADKILGTHIGNVPKQVPNGLPPKWKQTVVDSSRPNLTRKGHILMGDINARQQYLQAALGGEPDVGTIETHLQGYEENSRDSLHALLVSQAPSLSPDQRTQTIDGIFGVLRGGASGGYGLGAGAGALGVPSAGLGEGGGGFGGGSEGDGGELTGS